MNATFMYFFSFLGRLQSERKKYIYKWLIGCHRTIIITFLQIEKLPRAKFLNDYFPYLVLDEKNSAVFSEVFLTEKLLFLTERFGKKGGKAENDIDWNSWF